MVFADFDGDGRTDVAQSQRSGSLGVYTHAWRVSLRGASAWGTLRSGFVADADGSLREHFVGNFDGSPGADALRYHPSSHVMLRSSGARADYAQHSASAMR